MRETKVQKIARLEKKIEEQKKEMTESLCFKDKI